MSKKNKGRSKQEDPQEEQEVEVLHLPSIPSRVKSTVIDGVIILVLMFLAAQIFDAVPNTPVWSKKLAFVLVLLYEPILTSSVGTLGQRIMNIQVIHHRKVMEEGVDVPINLFSSILRYLAKITLGWLSLITISFNDEKRAIHDILSGSLMVGSP